MKPRFRNVVSRHVFVCVLVFVFLTCFSRWGSRVQSAVDDNDDDDDVQDKSGDHVANLWKQVLKGIS